MQDELTVDNVTEDAYLFTGDTVAYYIKKYQPGAASATVVATGTGGVWSIMELRLNKNDNMRYG